ncbi:MAG TPA: hypothetical protein VGF16_07980 [Bryobacteraceae bacterium]
MNHRLLDRIQPVLPGAIEISRRRTRFLSDMWAFRSEAINDGLIERIGLEAEARPKGGGFGFQSEIFSLTQLHEVVGRIRYQHDLFLGFLSELRGDLAAALKSRRRL